MNLLDKIVRSATPSNGVQFRGSAYGTKGVRDFLRDVIAIANASVDGPRYIVVGADMDGRGQKNISGIGKDDFSGKPAYEVAQRGIGLVPEGRQVFPNLSVRENLVATAANYSHSEDPWTLDSVLDFFPRLRERLDNQGSQLSGGEQQMLAIGRALMLNPRLLILDEATEGLAPLIRQEIWRRLEQLKQTGLTILLIDKNIDELTQIADRHFIIEKGQVVWSGDSDALGADGELKARYLGV